MKKIFFAFILLALGGCMHQPPQVIVIDSNVSAFVYQNEKRLGETPYGAVLSRGDFGDIYLKKPGYETVRLPAKRVFSRSFNSQTAALFDITTDANDVIEQGLALSTLIPSVPFSLVTDAAGLVTGYWIEYMPNVFYVEMIPSGRKQAREDILHRLQVKTFALVLYPSLAAGEKDYLNALGQMASLSGDRLEILLKQHHEPASFADAVAADL